VIEAMSHDKKAVDGKFTFVLIPRLGETVIVQDVHTAAVHSAILRQAGIYK
jgi:3-dehydroquinate synthetase